jgi:hypothetical protein
MKKLIGIFILIAVVLTSCNSGKNALVMKHRYTKGFYIAGKSKHHKIQKTDELANNKKTETAQSSTAPTLQTIENNKTTQTNIEHSTASSVITSPEKLVSENKLSAKKSEKEFKTTVLNKTFSNIKSIASRSTLSNKHVISKKGKSLSSDQIVQLILALFPILCLIAVYLKDGSKITNNFWITLVLHITVYLECIFAVLVVLDIINLA